jgi:hypothetical protein
MFTGVVTVRLALREQRAQRQVQMIRGVCVDEDGSSISLAADAGTILVKVRGE